MKKAIFLSACLLSLLISGEADAGFITGSLTASPSNILEGGTTNLRLELFHRPRTGFAGRSGSRRSTARSYSSRPPTNYYSISQYSGSGRLRSVNGRVFYGDGGSNSFGGSGSGNSFSRNRSHQYTSPGQYTARFSGSASFEDTVRRSNYSQSTRRDGGIFNRHYHYNSPRLQRTTTSNRFGAQSINVSTEINVANVAPTIENITWDVNAMIGQDVNFVLRGSDPYGAGSGERISFHYDLDNDGSYDDLTTFGFNSGGITQFNTVGTHQVNVQMRDNAGGRTNAMFSVNVSAVPEPGTFAMFGIGLFSLV